MIHVAFHAALINVASSSLTPASLLPSRSNKKVVTLTSESLKTSALNQARLERMVAQLMYYAMQAAGETVGGGGGGKKAAKKEESPAAEAEHGAKVEAAV